MVGVPDAHHEELLEERHASTVAFTVEDLLFDSAGNLDLEYQINPPRRQLRETQSLNSFSLDRYFEYGDENDDGQETELEELEYDFDSDMPEPTTEEWREELQSPMSPPPTYDLLLRSPALQRQWNIQPREDEGREELPAYSSQISLENVFLKKMELEGAVYKAADRGWYRVIVKLQGTALTFYKCKSKGFFGMFETGDHSPDAVGGVKRGTFLRSYNLQHADVGIAADYAKKRYVLRLRAEADQFLLSCHKIETFVLWLQSLFAAIDLAPPLDERSIPRDLSIPRRQRRLRAQAGFAPLQTAGSSHLIREQRRILLNQYPALGENLPLSPTSSTRGINPLTRPRSNNPTTLLPTAILSRARSSFNLYNGGVNPSLTAEGKWRPQHQWTHFYDMLYAKRCMAVLTHRSPRKSNYVIVKGKRWRIDWSTGRLEMCPNGNNMAGLVMSGANAAARGSGEVRPPSYAEVDVSVQVEVRHGERVRMDDGFLARSGGVAV